MKFFRNFFFFLSAIAAFAFGLPAAADSVALPGTTLTVAKPSPMPTPAPIGLSVYGWQQSSGVGQGYNTGGDGKGAVQTVADGMFKIGADTFLTGNSNPDCTASCKDTQAKLWIQGEQLVGARSTNQGVGNSPVSSVSGTNGYFAGNLQVNWKAAPTPAQPGTNVPTYPPIAATGSTKP